jgi:hypothetical protein
MLLGLILMAFYILALLLMSMTLFVAYVFIGPALWIVASGFVSFCAAFGPSLLSVVYTLAMHLKIFALPVFFPIVNRLEALTLWVVAICTGSFSRGTDDDAELENEYAGRLWQKVFTFAHLGAFESSDQLFAGNELKLDQ